jgi:putative membrane protein
MKTVVLLVTLTVFTFRSINYKDGAPVENGKDVSLGIINQFAVGGNYESMIRDTSSFVVKAIKSNKEEIMMSQMALQKSTNLQIKALAQKMVNDHQQLVQQLQGLSGTQTYADTSNMSTTQMHAYNDLSGMDFDRKWISDMIIGHREAINNFREELTRTNNAQIKTLISNALPIMQDHLRQLEALRAKMM